MDIDQKTALQRIVRHLVHMDDHFFDYYNIRVNDKGNCWILNYKPGEVNTYNKLTRGLVVSKPESQSCSDYLSLIKSFPFVRFFNRGEKHVDPVDMDNCDILEKLDGTLVCVVLDPSTPPGLPFFHTRNMVSDNYSDMQTYISHFGSDVESCLMYVIQEYISNSPIGLYRPDTRMTLMFELLSNHTQVVTQYYSSSYGLWLIGARVLENNSFTELIELELNVLADKIRAPRPGKYPQTSIELIIQTKGKHIKYFEGVVVRDRATGHRMKVKNEEYLKIHHMIGKMTPKNVLAAMHNGEYNEIEAYFPSVKTISTKIGKHYKAYLNRVFNQIRLYRSLKLDRKSLAQHIFHKKNSLDQFARAKIMKFFGEPDDNKILGDIDNDLKNMINTGQSGKVVELIGVTNGNT